MGHMENLEEGRSYIVKEEKPEKSYGIFKNLLKKFKGICVTRQHPEKVRKKYKVDTKIIWLSQMQTQESIEPTNLPLLIYTIEEFIKEHGKSVLLLDGAEYLIVHNDFITFLKYLHMIYDVVSYSKSILILPINPKIFSEKELSLLSRDIVVLDMEN